MSETIAAEAYRPRIMAAITHERHRLRLAAGRSSPDLKVVKDAVHNLRRLADRAHLTGLATVSGLIAARLRTIETGDAPSSILPALALAADQSITMAIIEA